MTGVFGLADDVCHARVPPERLIPNRTRIDVWELHRCGGLLDGTTTRLQIGQKGYRLVARAPDIFLDGSRIPILWDEPMSGCRRPWFSCPSCARSCRFLYLSEIACAKCLHLDWASRHLHRSTPGVHRIARWRRQLGLDPAPFGPIPERPAGHVRYHRIVQRIRAEELRLVGHLQTVTRDLERRIELRRARGEW